MTPGSAVRLGECCMSINLLMNIQTVTFSIAGQLVSWIAHKTRIVYQRKNRCLPLLGIKKITKLHLVKGNNLKNIHARVKFLMNDRLSECALQMCEVSLKYL